MTTSRDDRRNSEDHRRPPARSGRPRAEEIERATLSTWAVAASESKGRERSEAADPNRTAFEVDRDRILRSASFGALGGKAVGLPTGHHPTRAQQVARIAAAAGRLARMLRLNTDLTAAIAFAGSVGVPPFAEAGREAIASVVGQPFVVGEQSLRAVETLEGGGHGLNLTWEVRDGIVHAAWEQTPAATCEGQAVRVAARIVDVIDTWDRAGRPDVSADVLRAPSAEPDAIVAALVNEAAAAAADQPQVFGGDVVDRALAAVTEATARARRRSADSSGEAERAMHVVSSLLVYEVERAADSDLRHAVDTVCAWTDAAALAAFRDRFLPGAP